MLRVRYTQPSAVKSKCRLCGNQYSWRDGIQAENTHLWPEFRCDITKELVKTTSIAVGIKMTILW